MIRKTTPKKRPSDDGKLFEKFALEEGFWILVDGQITI